MKKPTIAEVTETFSRNIKSGFIFISPEFLKAILESGHNDIYIPALNSIIEERKARKSHIYTRSTGT